MTYREYVGFMTVEKNVAGLKNFHVGMSIIQYFGQLENAMGCLIVLMELMKATVIFVKAKQAGNVRLAENVLVRVKYVMGLMIVRINQMNQTVSLCVVISIGLAVKSTDESVLLKRLEVNGRQKLGGNYSFTKEVGNLEMVNQPLPCQVQIQSVQGV